MTRPLKREFLWMAIAFSLFAFFLTGCVGHMTALEKPPTDWPKLTITEHKGVLTTLSNCNGAVNLLLLFPTVGCAKIRLDKLTCDAYYMWDWVREGEIEHCDGRDHAGEDRGLREGWSDYKDYVFGHAVGAGWIATW